jgi:nucleoside-diphosphate-sugar epimerase
MADGIVRAGPPVSGRVLVTGASGFVGQALVRALTEAGTPVRAATRDPAATSFPTGVEKVAVADYRQPVDWAPLLAGVDAVVHLAGIAHIGPGVDDAVYDRVVHVATAELAAACAGANVRRLIFMSSVRAQSGPAADHVLTEDEEPHPSEAYGRAKLQAEAAVRAGPVAWTVLRPTMVYGRGAKGNLATLLRLADTSWPLPLAAFSNRRSLVSLDNLVAAVRFALGAPATERQTYLVADPSPVTLAEIVATLRNGLGRPSRLFPVSPSMFAASLQLIGRGDVWERLGGSLVVDPGKLVAAGWRPDADTLSALARMARRTAG